MPLMQHLCMQGACFSTALVRTYTTSAAVHQQQHAYPLSYDLNARLRKVQPAWL
jgi:hypothetical protein